MPCINVAHCEISRLLNMSICCQINSGSLSRSSYCVITADSNQLCHWLCCMPLTAVQLYWINTAAQDCQSDSESRNGAKRRKFWATPAAVGVRMCNMEDRVWQIPLGGGEGHFGLSTVTLIIINAKIHNILKELVCQYFWRQFKRGLVDHSAGLLRIMWRKDTPWLSTSNSSP